MFDSLANANPALVTTLEVAVPLHIIKIRDWTAEERADAAQDAATAVASHGDDLLYGGPHCAATFNALALGLACLAYAPGGVTFAGVTFLPTLEFPA